MSKIDGAFIAAECLPHSGEGAAEARKALACRAFWSDHPLNLAYREVVGDRPFSLREFVSYVEGVGPEHIDRWV